MDENAFPKLPQEIRDEIYTEVLRGGKYLSFDPEGWLRFQLPLGPFQYCDLGYQRPAYAGLLISSKKISQEMRKTLYKVCVFSAYLCKDPECNVPPPTQQEFARIQRIELFLDVSLF